MSKYSRLATCFVLALVVLLAAITPAAAQSISGTLTGIVQDKSEAVIPNATITLTNTASGDVRRTVSNAAGYFTIAAIPAGEYSVTVEAPGFQKWERTGIAFNGSDKRNLSDIVLAVGSTGTEVTVMSAVDIVTPVDSGEKSSVLTTKELQDFSVVGRSAAEFIKILPGFSVNTGGTGNKAAFSGEVIGINGNGDGGSQSALNNAYSYNGLPTNSMDITADGAHVSDPGCNCATPVNPNTDMIQEFKVLTSNFSAENSKGPALINTIAKAGGRDYHGEAYLYARNYVMNANDAYNNSLGHDANTGKQIAPIPENKFYFPGGNIGGPVLIPGTGFNHNRDKLFFFTGFEYYFQTLDTGVLTDTVPTAGMRQGNFSPDELAKLGKKTASGGPPNSPSNALFPGGIIPASAIDPGGQALMNIYPLPNADPNSNGGYNYVKQIVFDQNSWQWMSRVDYSISDNTKLFVRYNLQKERQLFPVGLWWRNGNQLPYPTPIVGKNQSQSVSASLTHVFSPSLTNEFVFGYTYIDFPNVFEDPSKVDRTKLGYPYTGLYHNGVKQIPALNGWGGSEFSTIFNPGGFEAGGSKGLFADKYLPSVTDNVSKVWGTHTMKFGGYYEFVINDQPANGYSNGQIIEANWAGNSTGSAYADLLTGRVGQYNEQNFNPLHNEAYNTVEGFAQDSWKATRRLTFELGLRISHFGNWYDRQGFGFAVWAPDTINPTAKPSDYTGLLWNKRNSNVPLSGFPGTGVAFAPRFGVAYDIFGSGKTVFRGGWGRFYFHNAQFTQGLDAPAGVQTQFLQNTTLAQIDATNPLAGSIGVDSVSRTDDKIPYTDSYSATISQRLPGASLMEISYVGNQSNNLLITNGTGSNVNMVPYGTFLNYSTDPNNIAQSVYDAARPHPLYQDVHVARHFGFQNYNAMQVTWVRQRGRLNAQVNYTYGKTLGFTGNDQIFLQNDYGPLGTDRRHIFNAAYSWELGNPIKDNKFLKGAINGWQLSGITQWQSGQNIAGSSSNGNFNVATNGAKVPGTNYNVSSRTILGTDSIQLNPYLICNPTSNLANHQYVNPSCFALPTTPGLNGPTVLPEMFGPAYFNSDLSLYKNFQISESKKIQFRVQAYNFLNHPLWSFRNGSSNLNLGFDSATGKVNTPGFGTVTDKEGHRIMQLALKYYF